ncbi:hypothetical protein AVEN_146933-1 [Araneus ventricosus]|uniref:Uncharacterized protein n=1 Tax=Araneus ventricosus TaxID=182803 RepID=A0A4Y2WRB6_ARAVE|nr:hypothetical protein AVEN_146933-1 [Araneus ventricosus]
MRHFYITVSFEDFYTTYTSHSQVYARWSSTVYRCTCTSLAMGNIWGGSFPHAWPPRSDTLRLLVMGIFEVKSVPRQTAVVANIERCHPPTCVCHTSRNVANDDVLHLTALLLNDDQLIEQL